MGTKVQPQEWRHDFLSKQESRVTVVLSFWGGGGGGGGHYALTHNFSWEGEASIVLILYFIIRLTHANVWESMGKPCSCTQFIKSRISLLQVMRQSVSVLQVTRESVSGTASHARVRIRYYKSRVLRMNVQ